MYKIRYSMVFTTKYNSRQTTLKSHEHAVIPTHLQEKWLCSEIRISSNPPQKIGREGKPF